MLNTDAAIFRLRRDLALGFLLKGALFAAGLTVLVVLPVAAPQVHPSIPIVMIAIVWLVLGYNSAKNAQLSAGTPAMIAAGQYEEAETQIDLALHSFSVLRGAKLQVVHQLALLRHAQKRFRESAALCQALLRHRTKGVGSIMRSARLLLADSMLELDDLRGVHDALSGLYADRLSLPEVLNLLAAQLDYESRLGAWSRMMHEAMTKVQLIELMPTAAAARTQALLALSARHVGRPDFCDWLRSRAELLADPKLLVGQRPMLAELWPGGEAQSTGLWAANR